MSDSILDNELVKKYFGCKAWGGCPDDEDEHIALRVILAMQEPIKKGDKYLDIQPRGVIEQGVFSELIWKDMDCKNAWHPHKLRLPSWFKTCDHDGYLKCVNCGKSFTTGHHIQPPPSECCQDKTHQGPCNMWHPERHLFDCHLSDAVEEKIKEMGRDDAIYKSELRDLVNLARASAPTGQ